MVLGFAVWFLVATNGSLRAQSVGETVSVNWQTELIERYARQRQRALQLARQRGWPLRKNYSNGRILQLQAVDSLGQPIYYTLHNAEAARGTRTQILHGGGPLPVALSGGSAFMNGRLGLWDGGRVPTSHREFAGSTTGGSAGNGSRVTLRDGAATLSDHATHLAGTLVALGVNPEAKGMAFGAQLAVWDYTDDLPELIAAAPNLLISNHAYGPVVGWVNNPSRPGTNPDQKWEWWGNTAVSATEDYLFGFYTTKARDLDRVAYNNPYYLMVRSADNKRGETGPPTGTSYFLKDTDTKSTAIRSRNDAYDVIPAEATAKNVLTVGAADLKFTAQQPVPLGTTPFSGWGPTDDGRIKPDLLGVGSNVFSTVSSGNAAYATYSGTSMASANVAGSLFLLQELYARQRGASATNPQFMRAATLRGLALHTADRPNPAGGPDYRQGWGLLNEEAAARVLLNAERAHRLLEQTLTPGSTFMQSVVAQGGEPLVVTLCWTDPEGAATAVAAASLNRRTPKLVNDLDLRVGDGKTNTLPWVLNPDKPASAATRGDNIRDNVEQVYIANPVPGQTYALTVSHKGKMTYSGQPFSLIVSGLRRVNCQLTVNITPSANATICAGAALLLRPANAPTGWSYQWLRDGQMIPDADDAEWAATQAGSYSLRVMDENGCQASSQPVRVDVRTPAAGLTPTGDQWLCSADEPILLWASAAASSQIEWLRDSLLLPDARTPVLRATQPGRYQIRVTDAGGCQAISTATVVRPTSVNNLDLLPKETELFLPPGATVSLKAPLDSSYRYQWYRNDKAIDKANDYRLSVSQPGTYRVQVRQQNCVGWSTQRIVQTTLITGLLAMGDRQFMLHPNPAENILIIRYWHPLARKLQIDVFDMRGGLRQSMPALKAINGYFEGELTLVGLPAGNYVLRLTDGTRTTTGRFIKK